MSRVNRLITIRGGFWWCSLAIAIAYASFRLYDLPVHEWLKKKLF